MSHPLKKNDSKPDMFSMNLISIPLKQETFEALAAKIYQIAGIHLPFNDKNHALMSNRLSRLLRDYNLPSYEKLNEELRIPGEKLKSDFICAMTTNKTDFFREEAHFVFLKEKLPEIARLKSEVRIWSSACSTGSEPFTIALVANEALQLPDRNKVKILGTDIDLEVLQKATTARYTSVEMAGVNPVYRQKYFRQINENLFELHPEIAKSIHFSEFNLMNFSHRFQKKFDVVFCRNVLIYFDKDTTAKVLDMLISNLNISGYLIIGHSESGVIKHPCLKSLGNSIFQKVRD